MRINLNFFCAVLALFGFNLIFAQTQLVFDPTFNPEDVGSIQSGFTDHTNSANTNLPTRSVKQPDGKVLFLNTGTTSLHGVKYAGIVRVNTDGSLDRTFTSPFTTLSPQAKITDALVQTDGKIIVCGEFNATATNPYASICRLNPDGSVDETFNAGISLLTTNTSVVARYAYRLQQDANGLIYIAGNFQTIVNNAGNEVACRSLAIINPDGTLNTARTSAGASTSAITDMIILGSGKVLIAGNFTNFDGYDAARIIRLNSDLSLDFTFNYDLANTKFIGYNNNSIGIKLFEFDNKVYVAHSHPTNVPKQYRGTNIDAKLLIRLTDDGSIETFSSPSSIFNQNFTATLNTAGFSVHDIVKTNNNELFIAGRFRRNEPSVYMGPVYENNRNLTRITLDGEIVPIYENGSTTAFKQNWTDTITVRSIVMPNDTTLFAITYPSSTLGKRNNHFAKFNMNLEEYTAFIHATGFTNFNYVPTATHVNAYSNTEQIISGNIHNTNFTQSRQFSKIDNSGSVIATLPTYTGGNVYEFISKTERIPSGPHQNKILAITHFDNTTNVPATSRFLNRYNADGTLDNTFTAATVINSTVSDFLILDDGKIVVVGSFRGANDNGYGAVLNSDGTLNQSFRITQADMTMVKIKKDDLGRIYIGGRFKNLSGFNHPLDVNNYSENFVRLNADLTRDNTFGSGRNTGFITPPTNELQLGKPVVTDFIILPDYSIIAIGSFRYYKNVDASFSPDVKGIVRIDKDGNYLNHFSEASNTFLNERFTSIMQLNDNEILLAGNFEDGSKLKRFNINGGLLETYNSPTYASNGTIKHLAKDPSGRIYVAGDFSKVLGANKNGVARFIYSVSAPTTTQAERSICENRSHLISDLLINDAGYTAIFGSNLKVYDAPTGGNELAMTDTLVDGNSYYFSQTINGDESISRLEIRFTLDPVPNHILEITSCQPYNFYGTIYTSSTSLPYPKMTIWRSEQCDSIVHLKYTRIQLPTSTQTITACDSFTWNLNGQTYTTSIIDSVIIQNQDNCDSTVYLNLTINNSSLVEINETVCGPFTWVLNGQTYNTSGVHYDTLQTANGCDSIIKLNLTVSQPFSFTENKQTCTSYTWPVNGETYSTDTTVVLNYTSIFGCDSIYTLNVSITAAEHSTSTVVACESYTWPLNGQTYTSSTNTEQFVIENGAVSGCDSIVTLNLTIYQAQETIIPVIACDAYTWSNTGLTYDESGVYSDTLQSIHGCDSIVKLDLTIKHSTSSTQNIVACDSYTWPLNGLEYTSSAIVVDTIPNAAGCDSIITLNLTINQSVTYNLEITACDEYTWPLNGQTYSSSTTDQHTIYGGAANGCDSTVNLILTINQTPAPATVNHTACISYTWPINNQTYDTTGVYTAVIPSANGCDSLINLNLTITPAPSRTITMTACDSYTWDLNNQTYYSTGIYHVFSMNNNECDSIIYLDLTVNYSNEHTIYERACESFYWDLEDETYVTSGTHTHVLQAANGCDSIVTLHLIIGTPQTVNVDVVACETYTWSVNGETYTTSTTASKTFTDINGCDSTVVLNLIIGTPTDSTVTVSACGSYTWSENGVTYDTPGIKTVVYTNIYGCDSTINLDLTLTAAPTVTAEYTDEILKASIENGDSYQWYDCSNNQAIAGATSATFIPTANGEYKVVVTTEECISTSSCVVVSGLSVKNVDNNYISIAPNPAHSAVQIKTENVENGTTVLVLDETGRIIYETEISGTSTQIEIQSWARGVYYVKVGSSYVEKLIKN